MSRERSRTDTSAVSTIAPLRRTLAAIAAGGLLAATSGARAADIDWTGNAGVGDSFWDLASNWLGNTLPGAADNARIGAAFTVEHRTNASSVASLQAGGNVALTGGTLNLGGNSFVSGSFTLGNGTLGGAGALTAGQFALTGSGQMIDPGTTTVTGAATFGDGANTTELFLGSGRALVLNGNSTFQSSALRLSNATLNNAGTFTSRGDVRPTGPIDNSMQDFGGGAFNNNGAYVQNSGTATTSIGIAFNNAGAVSAQSGRLQLAGGGSSSGSFAAGAGAVIEFSGGTHTLNGGGVSGAGTVRVTGGTTSLSSTTTYTGTGRLELDSGVFNVDANFAASGPDLLHIGNGTLGGTGSVTAAGFQLTGAGQMLGAGSTTITGAATFGDGQNASSLTLEGGRVLNLNGDTTFRSNGLRFNGATLNNAGTFTSLGDVRTASVADNSLSSPGGVNAFNNTGAYNQNSGSATTTIGVPFNNSGTLQAQSGRVVLSAGGAGSGNFTASAGTVIEFAGGEHALDGGTLSGPGTFRISGGTTTLSNTAQYAGSGTLELASGTFNVNGSMAAPGPALLLMGNGILGGAGSVTAASMHLTGTGQMVGAGVTTISGTATFGDGENFTSMFLGNGRVLNLNGSTTFQSNLLQLSDAKLNNAGTFTNLGDVRTTGPGPNSIATSGTSEFNNTGVYVQSSGSAQTTISVPFNNLGELRIDSGKVLFSNTFMLGSGSLIDVAVTALDDANIDVNAIATFDGVLRLDFAFAPSVGDTITVLTYAARNGEFDSIVGAGLAAGFVFTPVYGADTLQVSVAAVPEPETYALMLAGLGLVVLAGRRRRRNVRAA